MSEGVSKGYVRGSIERVCQRAYRRGMSEPIEGVCQRAYRRGMSEGVLRGCIEGVC